ncbi:MAG: hypothetical protein ACTSQG_06105, partial [Promethearchaeota archaeon]
MSLTSDQFFNQIRSYIKLCIEKKKFDLDRVKRIFTVARKYRIYELEKQFQDFSFYTEDEKINSFGNLFSIIKNQLRLYQDKNNIIDIIIDNDFSLAFLEDLIKVLILDRVCTICGSKKIKATYPISEEHTIYFCDICQKDVKVFKRSQYLPLFLIYIKEWVGKLNRKSVKKSSGDFLNNYREFFSDLILNCFDYFLKSGDINSFLFFYKLIERNLIKHRIFEDKALFKGLLINNLKRALKKEDFYSFVLGKNFYNSEIGNIERDIKDYYNLILKTIVNSLKSG